MLRFTGLAVTLGALASGCAGSTQQTVVRVAQHDLACDRVEVDEIAKNRYGAFGCGRGAVYTQLCEPGQSCRWGRLRHGHESALGAQDAAARSQGTQGGERPPRLILPAPAPYAREVLQAPPAPGRVVHPAPGAGGAIGANQGEGAEPAGDAGAPAGDAGTGAGGTEGPGSDASGASAPADAASAANNTPAAAAPAPDPQAPLSLSQGLLSDPYQTTVPYEQTTQRSELPPPVPLQETRPAAPNPTYVWVGGYWWWGSNSWLWLPGYWSAPRMGFSYIPGGWYWANNYWWYGPGGWAYPGSRVIVHRVPPRPTTYATVRSFTPNRAVIDGRGPRASAGIAQGITGSSKRMPGDTGFRPSDSPLRGYPMGTPRQSVGASSGMSTPRQSAGVGRVITPGHSVPNQNYGLQRGFTTPRGYSGSPHVSPPRMGSPQMSSPRMSAPRMGSPQMSSPRMSAPRMSAPRMSAPRMSSPRGGR